MMDQEFRSSLKQAFAIADLDSFYPSSKELESVTFSEEFENWAMRFLKRQTHFWFRTFNTVGKQVAVVALTVMLALSALTMSVKALREPFFEFITEVFERFTLVTFHEMDDQSEGTFTPLTPNQPVFIPEGFELTYDATSLLSVTKTYTHREVSEKYFTYDQTLKDGAQIYIDTEGAVSEKITVQGREALWALEEGEGVVFFTDEQYSYAVSGNVGKETLLKIAESIPLK